MTRPSFNRHIFRKASTGKPAVPARKNTMGTGLLNLRATAGLRKRSTAERRVYTRRRYSVPIVVSYFSGEFLFDTWTLNHSLGGLCFAARRRLEPGTVLYIKVKKFHPSGPCTGICAGLRSITLAEVVWSSKVFSDGNISYHAGVRYYESVY